MRNLNKRNVLRLVLEGRGDAHRPFALARNHTEVDDLSNLEHENKRLKIWYEMH